MSAITAKNRAQMYSRRVSEFVMVYPAILPAETVRRRERT